MEPEDGESLFNDLLWADPMRSTEKAKNTVEVRNDARGISV